jgi:glycine cleavage system transcriptional repressor
VNIALAVLGRDQPGIVAGVTGAVLDLGCNLEDVATTILRGEFAMMLVLSAPPQTTRDEVAAGLEPFRQKMGLMLSVWEIPDGRTHSVPTHALTVYGPDRMGIVHTVAEVLARLEVNICDMTCHLHEGDSALYLLTMEIEAHGDPAHLDGEIGRALQPLGLAHSLREIARELL